MDLRTKSYMQENDRKEREMTAILVTILIYSLILTIGLIIKDYSDSCEVDVVDIITCGIVGWIFILIVRIVQKFLPKERKKQKEPKKFNQKQLRKIAEKVIKIYKEQYMSKEDSPTWITFEYYGTDEVRNFRRALIPHGFKYEILRRKFKTCCIFQEKEIFEEIKKILYSCSRI